MKTRPHTLTEFRKLGVRKLRRSGRTAEEAHALHLRRGVVQMQLLAQRDTYHLPLAERIARRTAAVPLGQDVPELTEARRMFPHRKNWDTPRATRRCLPSGWVVNAISHGRYSSRCRYTRYTYEVVVTSRAMVSAGGGMLLFKRSNDPQRWIRAPRGYRWSVDSLGVKLVRSRDGADFHPAAIDLLQGARWVVERLRANAANRTTQAREMRREMAAIRRAEREGATVCLRDSIQAGNCWAGTRQWARKHGLDPSQHYRPSAVLALANGDTHRVALVVTVALRRHRLEMERGYASLADHR